MRGRVYILLPGVHTNPADWRNWAPRMATEISVRTDAKSDEFRYFTTAITRGAQMETRVGYISRLCERYWAAHWSPVLVAHSNGCEIARRAILAMPSIMEAVHFIAPPISPDMECNGLNGALMSGKLGHLYLYLSRADVSVGFLARHLGGIFGYGTLGADGPARVDSRVRHAVTEIRRDALAHTGWFAPEHWESTFCAITVHERLHS